MNPSAPLDNTASRGVVADTVTTAASTICAQLDNAIMTALREAGDVMPWAVLRTRLPEASNWAKGESLVRLHSAGQVDAFKVNGRTFVALSLVPTYLQVRGLA